ncbi:MAG TPA: YceI family protein [Thermoanaerobaculia bacterium]|nr:YceI family protein [Thermoanaerobaculia bacterium]
MNRAQLSLAALSAALVAAAVPPAAAAAVFEVDPLHSSIRFSVPYELIVLGEVEGQFREFAGRVVYDPEAIASSSVQVVIQAGSLDTGFAPRDRHLRGEEFLDTDRFPTISFDSTRIEPGAERHRLVGTLSLRGVAEAVAVPFQLVEVGDSLVVSGTAWLDRHTYGLGAPAALASGAFRLGDQVSVSLHLLLTRAPSRAPSSP